jgi:hypothetical protein
MSFCTWFGAIAGATLSHFNVISFHFPTLKIIKPISTTLEYFESVLSYDYFLKPLNLLSCIFIGAFAGLVTEMTWSVSFPTLSVFLISYCATSNVVLCSIQTVYCKFCKFINPNPNPNPKTTIKTTENLDFEDKVEKKDFENIEKLQYYDILEDDLVDLVNDVPNDLQTENTDTQNMNHLIEKSENFVKSQTQTSTTEATLGISKRKKIDKNIMF